MNQLLLLADLGISELIACQQTALAGTGAGTGVA